MTAQVAGVVVAGDPAGLDREEVRVVAGRADQARGVLGVVLVRGVRRVLPGDPVGLDRQEVRVLAARRDQPRELGRLGVAHRGAPPSTATTWGSSTLVRIPGAAACTAATALTARWAV